MMSEEFYIAAPVSLVTSDGGQRRCRTATSDETDLMEQAPALRERAEKAEAALASAKQIISRCADAIGNGAFADVRCSLEFMSHIPNEMEAATKKLRSELAAARAEIERLRGLDSAILDMLDYWHGSPSDLPDLVVKSIKAHGCGHCVTDTSDGCEHDCEHGYPWVCDQCPVFAKAALGSGEGKP